MFDDFKQYYGFSLCINLFVSFLFAGNDEKRKKPVKVLAIDYHGVIVKARYDKLTWCSAKIVGRNIGDSLNMAQSGIGIAAKAIAGQNLSIESILRDFPHLEKYEDEMYGCMNVLDQPNEETIAILKKLKQQGVKLVLASNMHEDSFEINKSRLKPELFELFDFYHIAGEKNGRKPDPGYYKNLRRRIEKKICNKEDECIKNMNVVFTDDLQENIEGSKQADVGIHGVHFSKAKKFEEDLTQRNFMKKE